MIKVNKIKPFSCRAYDPTGKYLGKLNEYEFNDLRIQIKKANVFGYYMKFNNITIIIDSDGRCDLWPDGFYDLTESQFLELL